MKYDLHPQELTHKAFAPYGDVISCDGEPILINNGTTQRFHDLANIDVATGEGSPLLNIFRGQPFTPPLRIEMMERHPLGSQTFVPLSREPFLVVVARAGEAPDVEDLVAFRCNSDQGVNYACGTWHHPLIALNKLSDFLVIDRGASENSVENENLDEYFFGEKMEIWLHGS